jgi:hypothetical protein
MRKPRLVVWYRLFEPVETGWVSYPRFREPSTRRDDSHTAQRIRPLQIRHRSNNVGTNTYFAGPFDCRRMMESRSNEDKAIALNQVRSSGS